MNAKMLKPGPEHVVQLQSSNGEARIVINIATMDKLQNIFRMI